jgi:hypothetical protein
MRRFANETRERQTTTRRSCSQRFLIIRPVASSLSRAELYHRSMTRVNRVQQIDELFDVNGEAKIKSSLFGFPHRLESPFSADHEVSRRFLNAKRARVNKNSCAKLSSCNSIFSINIFAMVARARPSKTLVGEMQI